MSVTRLAASRGITSFGCRPPSSLTDKEADDRRAGPLPQQIERDLHHAVRIAAAQQLDAQLVEQHQLLDLLGAGQAGERVFVRFLHGDRQVLHDRLHELRVVALGGRRLFRFVELELGRADANRVAVDDGRFVDLLPVDSVPLRLSASRTTQPSGVQESVAWTREQSGSGSEMWQSVPRPMSVSRRASSGKFVPARLPVRIVR